MTVTQSGQGWHIAFDAAHVDGHGAAPEAEGPGKVSGNTLQFTWKDTFSNTGTGTITERATSGIGFATVNHGSIAIRYGPDSNGRGKIPSPTT